jgi:hypothetical protein
MEIWRSCEMDRGALGKVTKNVKVWLRCWRYAWEGLMDVQVVQVVERTLTTRELLDLPLFTQTASSDSNSSDELCEAVVIMKFLVLN